MLDPFSLPENEFFSPMTSPLFSLVLEMGRGRKGLRVGRRRKCLFSALLLFSFSVGCCMGQGWKKETDCKRLPSSSSSFSLSVSSSFSLSSSFCGTIVNVTTGFIAKEGGRRVETEREEEMQQKWKKKRRTMIKERGTLSALPSFLPSFLLLEANKQEHWQRCLFLFLLLLWLNTRLRPIFGTEKTFLLLPSMDRLPPQTLLPGHSSNPFQSLPCRPGIRVRHPLVRERISSTSSRINPIHREQKGKPEERGGKSRKRAAAAAAAVCLPLFSLRFRRRRRRR